MLTTAAGVKDLAMFDHHGEGKKNTRQKQASNVEAAAMKHSCVFHVSTWERVIPKPAYKCNKHNVWDVKVPMTPIKRKEGPGTPKMRRSHFFCCSFLRFTAPWAPKKKSARCTEQKLVDINVAPYIFSKLLTHLTDFYKQMLSFFERPLSFSKSWPYLQKQRYFKYFSPLR